MAKTVRKNKATHIAPARLKRVSAYALRAMETERLNHSLSTQVSYYSELIQKHPGWIYAGVFTDDAITGTKSNRPEFQRMFPQNTKLERGSSPYPIDLFFTSIPQNERQPFSHDHLIDQRYEEFRTVE